MRKVSFTEISNTANFATPAYAMADEFVSNQEAVANAIARKNGLRVVNLSDAGRDQSRRHYEIVLGRPAAGGGFTTSGSVTVAI